MKTFLVPAPPPSLTYLNTEYIKLKANYKRHHFIQKVDPKTRNMQTNSCLECFNNWSSEYVVFW